MTTPIATSMHRGGTGEPLVLIHGFSGTWRVWEPILPLLEPSYRLELEESEAEPARVTFVLLGER